MRDRLAHRGPDDAGIWCDPGAGIALGHRRLAVLDLSPQGHQPMVSACGRYVLVYNGEIYNHRDLRAELESRGAGAPLVRACRYRNAAGGHRLLGCRGGGAAQRRHVRLRPVGSSRAGPASRRATGWGKSRCITAGRGNTFVFASELKAFAACRPWTGEVSREALSLLLRYSYVPAPWSIYRDAFKVMPGTLLRIDAATRKSAAPLPAQVYWSVQSAAEQGLATPFQGSSDEATDRLEELLRAAVGQQMVADVPLGAFLSGGIDSSTIVALMQSVSNRPVRTFTIAFQEPGYREAEYARAVAAHLATEHTELEVTAADALAILPRLPTLFDEPFADASQIPTFLVSQLTRRHVTVSLSGDGGDELFGGYNRYFLTANLWRTLEWLPPAGRRLLARLLAGVPAGLTDSCLGWLAPVINRYGHGDAVSSKLRKLAATLDARFGEELYLHIIALWRDGLVRGAAPPHAPFADAGHGRAAPGFRRDDDVHRPESAISPTISW